MNNKIKKAATAQNGESVQTDAVPAQSQPPTTPDGITTGNVPAVVCAEATTTPKQGVAIMAFDGGPPTRFVHLGGLGFRWDANGRSLLYIKDEGGVDNIWTQPIEGGTPTQLTHFVSDSIYSFDVSRDGKRLLMSRGRRTSDAVLIRDLR